MTKKRFLKIIHDHIVRVAVGPSATRGRGSRGAVGTARLFIGRLNVARFAVRDQATFTRRLDGATRGLMHALPIKARSWGLARKLLNIFLRACLYRVRARADAVSL